MCDVGRGPAAAEAAWPLAVPVIPERFSAAARPALILQVVDRDLGAAAPGRGGEGPVVLRISDNYRSRTPSRANVVQVLVH